MSDRFFDEEKSNEPWNNRNIEENQQQDFKEEKQYNIDEEKKYGIKENSSNFDDHGEINDTNESNMSSSYSFWAEQIAMASSDHGKEESNQNPFFREYLDEKVKKDMQNGAFQMNDANQALDGDKQRRKKKRHPVSRFVKFALGAALFGMIAGGTFIVFNTVYYQLNKDAVPFTFSLGDRFNNNGIVSNPPLDKDKQLSTTTVSDGTIEQTTDITDVVSNTMSSIVTITATYTQSYYDWFGQQVDQENEGGGSGIIVSKTDTELLIATNNHVVEGADPIKVKFIDGTEAEAIIKGTDAAADLAVISIDIADVSQESLNAITVATLGDSEAVKVGEMAIAIGNALGYGQSTTVGYISAKDREVQVDDKTMVLLQTDAAINPGNSGGALLNLKGEVIGINTVKYASSEVEGMGFAIPISKAMPIIDELMTREVIKDSEKGYLGVAYSDVTEEIATMYNWPVGVYVKEAVEGGSAAQAGIMTGDIIVKVNDTEITAGTQLKEKITSYRAGTDITVTVMRGTNGKFEEKQITVTLGTIPQQ